MPPEVGEVAERAGAVRLEELRLAEDNADAGDEDQAVHPDGGHAGEPVPVVGDQLVGHGVHPVAQQLRRDQQAEGEGLRGEEQKGEQQLNGVHQAHEGRLLR